MKKNRKKIFTVVRMTNGRGVSNLLVIINEAIPDMEIGDVVLIPGVNGYKDPVGVFLEIDELGHPLVENGIAIPKKYIYEPE